MMLLAFAAVPLFAQPGGGQGQAQGQRRQYTEEDAKNRVLKLSKSLECTPEQEKKLVDFEITQFRQSQAMREKSTGDRDAMRAYMKTQHELRNKKYAEILTREQLDKYNKIQEERRQQRQGGGQGQSSDGQRDRGRGGN